MARRTRIVVRMLSLCLGMLTLAALLVRANGLPTMPHAFYGDVTIGGVPAPVGTEIEARGTGVDIGVSGNPGESGNPFITTQVGQYGGADALDPKLLVKGEVADGTPIYFYVDGLQAQCAEPGEAWQDSFPFDSNTTTELDLRLTEPGTPTSISLYVPLVFN